MKKKVQAISSYIVIMLAVIMLNSCIGEMNSPGLEYTPDMYRSPAIEPYVDYGEIQNKLRPEIKVQQSAKRPPRYTIPYYGTNDATVNLMLPYHRLASSVAMSTHGLNPNEGWRLSDNDSVVDIDYQNAKDDQNPIELNKLSVEQKDNLFSKGKKLYTSMCSHCHGEKGDGLGPIVTKSNYTGVPNYKDKSDLSDGQIFYSIYYGKGAMGAHSMMLDKDEIWTLVHYVNKFRFDKYGEEVIIEEEASDSIVSNSIETESN